MLMSLIYFLSLRFSIRQRCLRLFDIAADIAYAVYATICFHFADIFR